jgi:hypothetical protein
MRNRILLALLLSGTTLLAISGQGPVPKVGPGGGPGKSGPPGTDPDAKPAEPAPPTPAAAASTVGLLGTPHTGGPYLAVSAFHVCMHLASLSETPRMTRLKQLQFDRRPSTILKMWSKRPDPKAPKTPAKDDLAKELEAFQKHVTLGSWTAARAYLAGLPEAEGQAAYRQLLQSLQSTPMSGPMGGGPGGGPQQQGRRPEQNAFTIDDVIGLAALAPGGLDDKLLGSLGAILRRALDEHTVAPDVVEHLKKEIKKGTGRGALTARQAAQVLLAAGEPVAAGNFLPSLDKAVADKDAEGLNLLARHFLGVHVVEKKPVFLERAWSATQFVLALGTAKSEDKEEAVRKAVELAPQIKKELGQAWLDQSFTKHPERGMDILATIGGLASQGLFTRPTIPNERLKVLQLQKTAVEALLKAAPEQADKWRDTLTLLAGVWMREAEFTNQMDHSGPRAIRDRYGRMFFMDDGDPNQMMGPPRPQNQPLPIRTSDILQTRPEKEWIARIDTGSRAKLSIVLARLFLKANDEKRAFPFIEELAPTNKEAARQLVNEFLRVWAATHDPNSTRQRFNPYMYIYGFEDRADGIPLTRSKQERNLVDLAEWVDRLRRLPLDRLDEELLVNAFTKCHSNAEVYRLEAIEKIFGPLAKMKPRTLAALIQKTRENLAGLWREPAEQQKKKTNRKQKDIQVEVLRGYALAGTVVSDALKQFPEDWSLHLARAALLHDETNYRQEIAKSADFSKKRAAAIAAFHKAAALYADQVKGLPEEKESIAVYQLWFNASLGACDLRHVDHEKLPDLRQAPLIRKALQALPGKLAERHLNKFALALFTNLSQVQPAAKHRYLKQGFAIVGDHKEAEDAKKVFAFYNDLITEIKLDVTIDGSDRVGHKQPFGVFVNIRHTREIERESGGFGRYLQNQNTMGYFYNYGRPNADYRDRFQAAVTEALKEQFEVLSITFQSDKVHSRATQEYGWRYTPYAYLLLKPRGPQVDKIPPLHMDLDFLDTSGYVILPVESAAVPIDATSERGQARPVRKLQVTQILDERQADKGKLGLEIKAIGIGLVGTLDDTLNLAPDGFEVAHVNDQGVSVAKFDEDGDNNAIVSERTWLVQLRARPDRATAPTTFHFAAARDKATEMTFQRYEDADLATVEKEVSLEHEYYGRSTLWLWAVAAASLGLLAVLAVVLVIMLRRRPRAQSSTQLPATLTPFTVTMLLRRIQSDARLSPSDRTALDGAIVEVERCYFAAANGNGELNLKSLAEHWVSKLR